MDIRTFFILSFGLSWSLADNVDLGTVIFANVLFRHGDRTPEDPYPNDPYKNESLWPVPFGQLTNLGKHQQLLLGRWLRNRYVHLLPEAYSYYDIHIQSTNMDRTLMSAGANLAGLYPPRGDQIWDPNINWMPIPIHTVPEHDDHVLAAKKHCGRYDYEFKKVMKSAEMRRIEKQNKKLYAYLTKNSGRKVESMKSIEYLYNVLYIETLYNKTLPEWTKSVFPDKLKPLAGVSFKIAAYNKILQRLLVGPLLKEMIYHMVKKSEGTLSPDRKLWIYSAHDTTVANMLMILGLFEPHCPPYTATVLLELRINSEKQYFVTVSYKNTSAEPYLFKIPGCAEQCSLNAFITLTKDVIPNDWEKECLMNLDQYESNSFNVTAAMMVLIASILVLFFLIVLIVGFVYWHSYRHRHQYYLRVTTDSI